MKLERNKEDKNTFVRISQLKLTMQDVIDRWNEMGLNLKFVFEEVLLNINTAKVKVEK